jgi:uncharacterized protein YndB with AHSA1/START domain
MVTASKTDNSVLEIQKTLQASVEKVYRAWTEPDQMSKWFGCAKVGSVEVSQDLRPGGAYRIDAKSSDDEIVTVSGNFIEIIPNRKLVYSWNNTSKEYPASNTLVTVLFIDNGDTTEIKLTHSKFDRPIIVQGHTMGWGAALEKLETLLT